LQKSNPITLSTNKRRGLYSPSYG